MQTDIRELICAALKLPPEARGALANHLIESLRDEVVDADAEIAWEGEIARRIEELDSGKIATVPWFDARQQILRAK